MWLLFQAICLCGLFMALTARGIESYLDDEILRDSSEGGKRNWKYSEPDLWPVEYCSGKRQSPINIDPSDVIEVHYPPLELINYQKLFPINVTTDGITVKVEPRVSLSPIKVPHMRGGGLNGRYDFAQFHFHWGSASNNGSEHTIASKSYAAEIHLVHYKSDYGSLAEALHHQDGLAALGILVQEGHHKSHVNLGPLETVDELFHLDGHLPQVAQPNISLPLKDLFPRNVEDFYRYSGSLTTPACNEVVTWTVFKEVITLSTDQLNQFRKLPDMDGHNLVLNTRPTQPLNGRIVAHRGN